MGLVFRLDEGPAAANKCAFCALLATGKAERVAREERAALSRFLPGGQLSPSPRSMGSLMTANQDQHERDHHRDEDHAHNDHPGIGQASQVQPLCLRLGALLFALGLTRLRWRPRPWYARTAPPVEQPKLRFGLWANERVSPLPP